MVELQLLSELLPPAAPPSLEVVAATRARLAAEPSRARPLPRAVTGRGRPHGWVLAAGAAAPAAVVAAVTLTAGGTSAPAAQLSVFQLPAGAAATGTGGPGRPILLTAARAVARGAPTTLMWRAWPGWFGAAVEKLAPGQAQVEAGFNRDGGCGGAG